MFKENPPTRLRPAAREDESFLLEVFSSTRAEEMALVPWDEAQKQAFLRMQFTAQQEHYRTHYPEAKHDIILSGDEPVGRLYVDWAKEEIKILDITVLPRHRGSGIGSSVLHDILAEAKKSGRALLIYVETFNPSVRLFERLGFSKIKEDGINFLMRWHPDE
jgi:ribosomal protein S18 acetylase RimI-like enzyme